MRILLNDKDLRDAYASVYFQLLNEFSYYELKALWPEDSVLTRMDINRMQEMGLFEFIGMADRWDVGNDNRLHRCSCFRKKEKKRVVCWEGMEI